MGYNVKPIIFFRSTCVGECGHQEDMEAVRQKKLRHLHKWPLSPIMTYWLSRTNSFIGCDTKNFPEKRLPLLSVKSRLPKGWDRPFWPVVLSRTPPQTILTSCGRSAINCVFCHTFMTRILVVRRPWDGQPFDIWEIWVRNRHCKYSVMNG